MNTHSLLYNLFIYESFFVVLWGGEVSSDPFKLVVSLDYILSSALQKSPRTFYTCLACLPLALGLPKTLITKYKIVYVKSKLLRNLLFPFVAI